MPMIVMTGGTSGLGAIAAARMVEAGANVLLGAREDGPFVAPAIHVELTRLAEVRSFAAAVERSLGRSKIDALVLNAGGYAPGSTLEGYNATFVLNHLAHYLLIRLLWHRIRDGGMVLLTTSGTHDPAERTVVPPPLHANALWLANPEVDPHRDPRPRTAAMRAYSSAKLCVVLTARALDARHETRARGITVLAYDPGPTPGTGLVRGQGPLVRFLWQSLSTPLRLLMRSANSVEAAGDMLASLALGNTKRAEGRVYAALRRGQLIWPELSPLARRDDLAEAVWRESGALVGLPA